MKRGSRAIVGLATAMVALGAASALAAKTVTVPSSLTTSAYGYFGKVMASRSSCVADRKVVLKQKNHGVLGRTTSDEKGEWRIDPEALHFKGALPYKVYAVLKPSSDKAGATVYKCLGATGKTVTINGG